MLDSESLGCLILNIQYFFISVKDVTFGDAAYWTSALVEEHVHEREANKNVSSLPVRFLLSDSESFTST